jgi:plastocyanin
VNRRPTRVLAIGAAMLLAACSSNAAPSGPPASPPVQSSALGAPDHQVACMQSSDPGRVQVVIKDFAFGPADISANVGEVIAFSNRDSESHTATLDDGSCSTGMIGTGASDGLIFTVAGTYTFYCKLHNAMKGTITVG